MIYCQYSSVECTVTCNSRVNKNQFLTILTGLLNGSCSVQFMRKKCFCISDIPSPDCLTVDVDLTSVSVTFRKPAGVDQASYLLTLCSDEKSLQTVSIRSLQHCFAELSFEREYSISVSTVLKRRQSKPISTSIRTSKTLIRVFLFVTICVFCTHIFQVLKSNHNLI